MNILLSNLTKMVDDSGGMAKVTCNFADEMKKEAIRFLLCIVTFRRGNFIIR